MRHLAAYMLAKLAGKAEPTVDDIKKILASVDGDCKDDIAKAVVDSIKNSGKSYEELIESGKSKMASLPVGGGAAAPAAAAADAPKEEEKKEETEEEIIAGFGFDDDDD